MVTPLIVVGFSLLSVTGNTEGVISVVSLPSVSDTTSITPSVFPVTLNVEKPRDNHIQFYSPR